MSSRAMSTNVDKIGCALPWRRRVMVVGNTKRDVFVRQKAQDRWRMPTRMPKLETITPLRRQHPEKGRQAIRIGLKVWGQLKKHRANFVAKQRQTIFHQLEAVHRVS